MNSRERYIEAIKGLKRVYRRRLINEQLFFFHIYLDSLYPSGLKIKDTSESASSV